VGGRLRRLEEACQVIRSLFANEKTRFEGEFYQLDQAPLEPKPVQARVPLLIGGGGEKVTMRIAARYADEWNVWGDVETLRHKIKILDAHCEDAGRDPREVQRAAVAMLFLSDDREFIEKIRSGPAGSPIIAGNVQEVTQTVEAYVDAGVDELVVPDFNLGPMEAKLPILDRFITEIAPAFRTSH
jgi:alkanesulfonate monooxygenase SsuD/methylene tetrahydromethanopterin reductase-like flavin-dependent oxidoreductase (luciferase family)